MVWPATVEFTSDNLDAGADNPSLARADLYEMAVAAEAIIESRGEPEGVASLGADGLIPLDQLPLVPLSGDVVPLTKGGTGATNAPDARVNLGIGDSDGGIGVAVNTPFYLDSPSNTTYIKYDGTNLLFVVNNVTVFSLP